MLGLNLKAFGLLGHSDKVGVAPQEGGLPPTNGRGPLGNPAIEDRYFVCSKMIDFSDLDLGGSFPSLCLLGLILAPSIVSCNCLSKRPILSTSYGLTN